MTINNDIITPDEILESKQMVNKNESLPTSQVNASFMSAIQELMLRRDLDLDRMDKYLDIQERILNKKAETEFNIALSEMQPKLPIIKRATKGQNNKYASHEDIMVKYLPILSPYGFSLSFDRKTIPEGIIIIGTLAHKGGHKNTVDLPLPLDTSGNKNNVQAVGSTIKYGMRYAIQMLLNVVTANDPDDDDGRAAGITNQQTRPTHTPGGDKLATKSQINLLKVKLNQASILEKELCDQFKLKKLDDLALNDINNALDWIKNPG